MFENLRFRLWAWWRSTIASSPHDHAEGDEHAECPACREQRFLRARRERMG